MAFGFGTPGNDSDNGTLESDIYSGLDGDDTIKGNFGSDQLSGDAGADTIDGESGDDRIIGGEDADQMAGGIGDDTFLYVSGLAEGAGDRVNGGLGFDTLFVDFSDETTGRTLTARDPVLLTTLEGDLQVRGVEQLNLQGGSGADTFTGERWNDILNGGEGGDTLNGGIGSDFLNGGAGNDTLNGGNGNDFLLGDEGNDALNGGYGSDRLDGGEGDDRLNGGDGRGADVINITFGEGVDRVNGGTGSSDTLSIDELSGNFTAKAANVVNTIAGGTTIVNIENYWLSGTNGNNVFTTGSGNDLLFGGRGADTLRSGAGSDFLSAEGGGKDTLDGGAGIDFGELDRSDSTTGLTYNVTGANGASGALSDGSRMLNIEHHSVVGGSGNDTFSAGTAQFVAFDGGLGNDRLTGGAGVDRLEDSGGNNTIDAGANTDFVTLEITAAHAGGDTSTIRLGSGDDFVELNLDNGSTAGVFNVDGGAGTDFAEISRATASQNLTFTLSSNATLVNGGATFANIERVHLIGGTGSDRFTGGSLADILEGGSGGSDILNGGGGADELHIGNGDTANGGAGSDRAYLDLSALATGVTFTLTTGTVAVNGATQLIGIEALTFIGTTGNDRVTAAGGADVLSGGAGNDTLNGAAGNDVLTDGAGNDTLNGGAGNDTLYRLNPASPTDTDTFNGGAGTGDTLSFATTSGLPALLDLANQSLNDGLANGLTVSQFEVYVGSSGDDRLLGSSAGETLIGGGGGDILNGRGGNDTLQGGGGGDLLTGGAGADRFAFGGRFSGDASDFSGAEIGTGDEITDFTRGTDHLLISRTAFGLANTANTVTLVNNTTGLASGAKAQFVFETDNGRLWFDADGAGNESDAVLVATLDNVTQLRTSDFLLN